MLTSTVMVLCTERNAIKSDRDVEYNVHEHVHKNVCVCAGRECVRIYIMFYVFVFVCIMCLIVQKSALKI